MALTTIPSAGGISGLFFAMGMFMLIIWIALYVYLAIALMAIAKKTKTPNRWLAWIPIANFYLLTQMADVSELWTLMLLAMIIPIFGALAVLVCGIWMFWRVAEKINMPGWTSLLLVIPLLNLIVLGIYAWYK